MRSLALLPILLTGCTLYFEEELGDPTPPPTPSIDEAFGSLRWAITVGGTDDDGFAKIAMNAQGDVIVASAFQGTLELDGVPYYGGTDGSSCFIMPLDGVDGTPRWVVPLLGYSCGVHAVAVDPDGNVIVAGSYSGTFDFGGESLSSWEAVWSDMFVASYTPDGTLRWVRGLGPVSGAHAEAIAVAANGDVFVGGSYNGSSDLGGEWNPAENESEAFLVAYDRDGAYRWGHAFISDGSQGVTAIGIVEGDPVVSGFTSYDASFGGDVLLADARTRSWLARYSPDGDHVWSRTIGPDGSTSAAHSMLAARADGTIIVASNQSSDGSFPNGTFVRAFDPDGGGLWEATSSSRAMVHALALAPTGAILLGGFIDGQETQAFGASTLHDGMVIVAHDPAGIPIEGRSYEGTSTGNDIVTGVATSPNGATAIAGGWERTIDIGTGELVSAGRSDIVIAVFNPPGD